MDLKKESILKIIDRVHEMDKRLDVYSSNFSAPRLLEGGRSDHHFYEFRMSDNFGVCLFLDGILQSSQKDQALYHECMTKVALERNPNPQNALIVGGAGGGLLHHLLKRTGNTVRSIHVVDIDQKLFEIAPRYMVGWSHGELGDERVKVLYEEGASYLHKTDELYDIIFLDVGDPLDFTKSKELYTTEVFSNLDRILTDRGVVAFHTASIFTEENVFVRSYYDESLSKSINAYNSNSRFIESFERKWTFNVLQKSSPTLL